MKKLLFILLLSCFTCNCGSNEKDIRSAINGPDGDQSSDQEPDAAPNDTNSDPDEVKWACTPKKETIDQTIERNSVVACVETVALKDLLEETCKELATDFFIREGSCSTENASGQCETVVQGAKVRLIYYPSNTATEGKELCFDNPSEVQAVWTEF